jgi:hypothetical protein
MQDWQQRVYDEQKELDQKHRKLINFLNGPLENIPSEVIALLKIQASIMEAYIQVLEARMGYFTD